MPKKARKGRATVSIVQILPCFLFEDWFGRPAVILVVIRVQPMAADIFAQLHQAASFAYAVIGMDIAKDVVVFAENVFSTCLIACSVNGLLESGDLPCSLVFDQCHTAAMIAAGYAL